MKNICASLLLAVASIASGASAQTGPIPNANAPEISTMARGDVNLLADRAYVNFSIETRNASASEAGRMNSQRTVTLIDALKNAGVAQSDIVTSGYSVEQDYESDGKRSPRPVGFVVRNSIRVTLAKVENVGRIIDAGLAGGAMQVSVLQLGPADTNDARRRALALAVEAARRDAEAMATAAGGSLGRLIQLTSYTAPTQMARELAYNQIVVTGAATGGYNGPTPFSAREITISATAQGRWEFIPADKRD
jgi:uncharacterized protein YggE